MTWEQLKAKALGVLGSRKFWFGLVLPISVQVVALSMGVITPAQFVGALTATTSVFTGSVALEDSGRAAKAP